MKFVQLCAVHEVIFQYRCFMLVIVITVSLCLLQAAVVGNVILNTVYHSYNVHTYTHCCSCLRLGVCQPTYRSVLLALYLALPASRTYHPSL